MSQRPQPNPNVLFITVDQWRGDCLSHLGHPCVRTPHLDRLAADGTSFTRHYSQAVPCSPGRASLYTGLYLMNHRVCVNGTPHDARHTNIALEARRAGYEPTLFGYTDQAVDPRAVVDGDPRLQTYEGIMPGFQRSAATDTPNREWLAWLRRQGVAVPEGFDALYDTEPAAAGALSAETHLTQHRFGSDQTETRYISDRALEFIGAQAGPGWFAHVSFIRPHPPFSVPEPYASLIAPSATPAPNRRASLAEEQSQHPLLAYVHERSTKEKFVTGQGGASAAEWTAEEVAEIRAIYYGMIAEVDAEIGRLIGHLRDIGIYDDTLIVLTSDHGELLGDHFLFGKLGYFDAAYHIPLIIKAPGAAMKTGQQVSHFTENIDVMPTILDLIGVEIPTQIDGRSLVPFLKGAEPGAWRTEAHWEYDFRDVAEGAPERRFGLSLDQCQLSVLRDTRYKYVHMPGLPPVFFDLGRDPNEFENRAADPDYQGLVLQYAQKMLSWRMTHADRTLTGTWLGAGGPVTRSHAARNLAQAQPANGSGLNLL